MASRYDDLDASTELEQRFAADLSLALEPRGCVVVHHGTNNGGRHSPGGVPDIEIIDNGNSRKILVEITKRHGSAADGEFPAVTAHLNAAVGQGGFEDFGLLYVSPRTSARMSTNFRDLYNRNRERDGELGRIVALDFEAAQLMLDRLIASDPQLYPADRIGELLSSWDEAVDDARTRQLVQRTLFPEDLQLGSELAEEAREYDAEREKDLKRGLEKVENAFRSYGITGNNANTTLVFLAFIRLYEEKLQRQGRHLSRFTSDGFVAWTEHSHATIKRQYRNRMIEALLREIAEDPDLQEAGLLQATRGVRPSFHGRLTDDLVKKLVLPLFDQYDFHAGRVDVLGAVFETLARRSEKDTRVGQFFTPQQVVDFAADLVQLRPQDVVLDPAVGTGRFLIAAMDRMLDNADAVDRPQGETEASIRQHQLFGTDIDDWVATIAKMNMFIHGDGKSGIVAVNGLVLQDRPALNRYAEGFGGNADVVLTNPPLGSTDFTVACQAWQDLGGHAGNSAEFYDSLGVIPMVIVEEDMLASLIQKREKLDERIEELREHRPNDRPRGALTRAQRSRDDLADRIAELRAQIRTGDVTRVPRGSTLKGGALFLGAISNYLRGDRDRSMPLEWQGGAAAIVVDEAVLNTPEYARVRAFVRSRFFVKAVVSLSRDAFKYLAHTDAKTSIVFLIKKPSASLTQREPVFYSHADRIGYSATGDWIGDDLPQVLLQFEVFKEQILSSYQGRHLDAVSALALSQSLPGHSTSFFVRPIGSEGERLDFFDARFQQRRVELRVRYGELGRLGDVLEVAPVVHPPASRTGEYDFAVATRTGTIAPKGRASVAYSPNDLWVVEAGHLVLSSIDLVHGAIAVAYPRVEGLIMSKEMYAYRVRDTSVVVPEYLQLILRSRAAREMLFGLATGTSNRTRLETPERLLEFPIPPLPSREDQEALASRMVASYAKYREADEELTELLSYSDSVLRDPSSSSSVAYMQPVTTATARNP